jgi:hypothetical protein
VTVSVSSVENSDEYRASGDLVTCGDVDSLHCSGIEGDERLLHLHRLEGDMRCAGFDLIPFGDEVADYRSRHKRSHRALLARRRRAPGKAAVECLAWQT